MDSGTRGRRRSSPDMTADSPRTIALESDLLEGYPEMLRAALATGRRLTRRELASRQEAGRRAAEGGVPLRSLLELYLTATRVTWHERSPEPSRGSQPNWPVTEAGFRAIKDAVVAVTEGYESAHHLAVRQEEAARREFIDDLFYSRSDPGSMAERAQRFGLRLAEAHIVAIVESDQRFEESTHTVGDIESALLKRFDTRDLLFTTKDGSFVCIVPSTLPNAPTELANQVAKTIGPGHEWRVGIGREHRGPGGVLRSYEEARASLDFATCLGTREHVIRATDFLVFQVLLRDRAAIEDLITTVLTPLERARGGAAPLVETLASYFSCGTIQAAAAELNLSVRAVSYRIDRIRRLTGYSATDPNQRFTLEAAVLGAKLLGWPGKST